MNGIWILIGVVVFIFVLFRYIEKSVNDEAVKSDADAFQQEQLSQDLGYIVLDTETTGLGDGDEIIEISIIDQNGNILLDTLIRPSNPMPDDCFAITVHGITNSMLADAPTWKDVYPDFKKIISEKQIIIYNAAFDTRLIEQTCHLYGLGLPNEIRQAKCAMLAFAEWLGQWDSYRNSFRWHKLEKAADILLIEFEGQKHRALSDCRVTLAVWQYIQNHTRQDALESLKQCLKEQQQQWEEHRNALQLQVMKDVGKILNNTNNIVLNINACGKIETSQILEITVVDMSGKVLLT